MEAKDIERVVRRGLVDLGKALAVYWPARHNNDVKERNLSLYVAHAFRKKGYLLYAECDFPSLNRWVDFVAVHPSQHVLAVVESKRFYTHTQTAGLIEDANLLAPTLFWSGLPTFVESAG